MSWNKLKRAPLNNRGLKIAVLVSNDLTFDQRVRKTCEVMIAAGHEPILVGRALPESDPYDGPGSAVRFPLFFKSGPLFYTELQISLLKWLGKAEIDRIWANDLDTLLPSIVVGRHRKIPVVYDSHEFFTEAAGLTGKPLRRKIWLFIEKYCISKLDKMLTVNESIAKEFRQRYGVKVDILRNMPVLKSIPDVTTRTAFLEFGIPTDLPILLLQGAYMDRDRGTSDAVDALAVMTDVRLVLVGAGIEFDESVERMNDPRWKDRLHCIPRLNYDKLRILTASAESSNNSFKNFSYVCNAFAVLITDDALSSCADVLSSIAVVVSSIELVTSFCISSIKPRLTKTFLNHPHKFLNFSTTQSTILNPVNFSITMSSI